ncbi:hypothetical protein QCA50_014376 [Cerrena zonata]|uniref:F-box domain-containing protein n=1 Tax=Cerrena zonata TaxID=2478898 RepID=A0AAW0FZ01_9APHY
MLSRTFRRARSTFIGKAAKVNEPPTSSPSPPRQVSQTIPPEILLDIFGRLRPSGHLPAYEEWYVDNIINVNPSRKVIPRHLYNVCLVCRAWYQSGIVILYSRVALTSPRRFSSFRRTMQSRPDLIHYVRELSLCDAADHLAPIEIVRSHRSKQVAGMRSNALSIIATCSNLSTLTIYLRKQAGKNSIAPLFRAQLQTVLKYRPITRFTIIGEGPCPAPLTTFFDSGLKDLVLRRTVIEAGELDPKRLPELQTLALISVRSTRRAEMTRELLVKFKQLRTFVIVDSVTLMYPFGNPIQPACLPNLQKLTLISTDSDLQVPFAVALTVLKQWITPQTIPNVRDLTIGLLGSDTPLAPWFIFPPKLESLTLIIAPSYSGHGYGQVALDSAPQWDILRCLEHNRDHFERGTFKTLILLLCVHASEEGIIIFPHRMIRTFCEQYGVDVMQGQIKSVLRWVEKEGIEPLSLQ